MVQEEGEGEEEDIGNEYVYPEEDLQAHSTRAEDFNFSELIKRIQNVQLLLISLLNVT